MKPMPDETLEKLLYFRQEIDKIFQEFFDQKAGRDVKESGAFEIPVDIFERVDELVVVAELPGVSREEFTLSALRDVLILEGTKTQDAIEGPSSFVCAEREFGAFRRIVEVPAAGDMSRVQATFHSGVLTVRLPKIRERRGRKIQITIG